MASELDPVSRLAQHSTSVVSDALDELCDAGVARLLEIASGALTYGEIVGEGDEVVSRVGPSM